MIALEHERYTLAGVWPGVFGSHHPGYLAVAAGAIIASAFALKRGGPPVHTLALLLLIWFVATPYSHAYDTTMLIVPIAVLGAYPSVLLVDCWVAAALSFYNLSTAVIVAPLLLIGYVAKLSQWRAKD